MDEEYNELLGIINRCEYREEDRYKIDQLITRFYDNTVIYKLKKEIIVLKYVSFVASIISVYNLFKK